MHQRRRFVVLASIDRRLVLNLVIVILMAALGIGFAVMARLWWVRDYGLKVEPGRTGEVREILVTTEQGEPPGEGGPASGVPSLAFAEEFSWEGSRLARERARSYRIELLREIISDKAVDASARDRAEAELVRLMGVMEKEMQIEELIGAIGYREPLAFLGENSCDVMVVTDGLTAEEAGRIGDIVARVTGLPLDRINIVERKEL